MDKAFINKVQQIILNHIEDEKLNVNTLSFAIGLSRSQVWRKVKALTGMSVNQFICEVRLKEAVKLIQKDEFTAAEIAYKVGFNSPSYFHKCFHDHFGVTPGDYKTEKEESDNLILKTDESNKVEQQSSKSKKFILYSLLGLLIIAFSYYFYSDYIHKTTLFKKKSNKIAIAILPFKDLSSESDTQWFCDGVVEDIISNLSKIEGLRVISRTSTERYKERIKSIPKIAKELGVSHIVEGSIRKEGNRVLITAQLINANDNHLWTENYNEKLENIFQIQSDVSKKIVHQLNIAISPEEEKAIEKYPTDNLEAYYLLSKGRLINDSRKKEDLELNIKLNKQAIVLDPNYVEAYTEIAYAYYVMGNYGYMDNLEAKNKAISYVKKSLKLKPNSRAYAIIGFSFFRKEKYKEALEYLEKSIALNPNDAAIRHHYGRVLLLKSNPDLKNYLIQLKIAQELNPFSRLVIFDFFYALLLNDKFEEAEKYLNKMSFAISKEEYLLRESTINVIKNKDWTEAIRFFEKKIEKDPNNSLLFRLLGNKYNVILNDDINFIKYTKKSYELDSTISSNAFDYHSALVEGKKFAAAKKLMQSQNYKSVLSKKQELIRLFYYYYHQEDYLKALEVFKDSLMDDKQYFNKAITYTQLGDIKNAKKNCRFSIHRAFINAILKEKDSMYHYLELPSNNLPLRMVNSRREFDPYRKEERYKTLLRKNYLPITHWNE